MFFSSFMMKNSLVRDSANERLERIGGTGTQERRRNERGEGTSHPVCMQ